MITSFSDLHCHSSLKSYGKTFSKTLDESETSPWNQDRPDFFEKMIDIVLNVSLYSQSDLTSCSRGKVLLTGLSLYAPEVKFFKNKLGEGKLPDELENIITGFGIDRIEQIESNNYNYFNDLTAQYEYLKQWQNKEVKIKGKCWRFNLISSSNIQDALLGGSSGVNVINIFLNIEGAHSFGCGQFIDNNPTDITTVLNNIDIVKNWQHRPAYITIAHHFYNEICGHAKSFTPTLSKFLDQSQGLNSSITPLGFDVIEKLLDNTLGNRILIDLKHMSTATRQQYYKDFATSNVPLIFSHGGVNGLSSVYDDKQPSATHPLFNSWNINLFDDEIIFIGKSKGLIGLNFDQRVMASQVEIDSAEGCLFRRRMYEKWSKLICNNIFHISEKLDKANLPAWDNICLGTDFDGAINPINGFWSEEEMPRFSNYLLKHLTEFLKMGKLSKENSLEPEEIVVKIMSKNISEFLSNNYSSANIMSTEMKMAELNK